ncbi:MAG: coproporphyrinogen dehydrogenase HemZ [Ruminococcaceae bacterium]|nr:coproporphyrinogen dehydrogenase HemZ [Oscillospiraceae bacterium]
MRLKLEGKINSLYVQSLCMMFFRGEKFPLNEENPKAELYVKAIDEKEGVSCVAELICDSKAVTSQHFEAFNANDKYERTSKMAIGHAVFDACVRLTGYLPPWGLLTGIRPSVVADELISKYGETKAIEILQNKYLLSSDKAKLAVTVAKNEKLLLDSFDTSDCSIYISIPFCPTRCTYCSFISYATKKLFELIPQYIDRIIEETKDTFQLIKRLGLRVSTIYIGGGTPTTLSPQQLERLLSTVKACLGDNELAEFTVEGGRPDTITEEKLSVLKKYGVDRISVNPQSLNDEVLQKIGRKHSVKDFYDAYDLVSKSGINVVNTDLIAGLDGDSLESFKETVDKIIELNPENVTVHSFSVKKSAQILKDNSDIYNSDGGYADASVNYAYQRLTGSGYIPYYMYRQKNTVSDLENVGYAKKGTFGAYNVLMMGDGHTVFGIGAGATTKLVKKTNGKTEILRIFSPKYPYEYLQDNQSNMQKIIDFLKGGSSIDNY